MCITFVIKQTLEKSGAPMIWIVMSCLLNACGMASSPAAYEGPPSNAITRGSGSSPVDPDTLQVNSSVYPQFHVLQLLSPPEIKYVLFGHDVTVEMVPINPSDTWHVTHLFANRYLIESDEYNDRECRLMAKKHQDGYINPWGKCLRQHDYTIFVTLSGEVSGGWQLLPGPQLGGSNRYTYLSYAPEKNAGWPVGTVFHISNAQN